MDTHQGLRLTLVQDALPSAGEAAWLRWLTEMVGEAAPASDFVILPPYAGTGPEWPSGQEPPAAAWARYLAWGASLARSHGVWLVPGTVVCNEHTTYRHRACLFTPTGDVLGSWAQWTFTTRERQAGWRPEAIAQPSVLTPAVVNGCGWQIASVLGHDVSSPEIGRWLRLGGGELVIGFSTWPEPDQPWRHIAGPWAVVQENQFHLAEVTLAGNLRGQRLSGSSRVWAPCEITPGEQGWLVQAAAASGRVLVRAALERTALLALRKRYDLMRSLNPGLYRRAWGGGAM